MSTHRSSNSDGEIPVLVGHERRVLLPLASGLLGILGGFALVIAGGHFAIPFLVGLGIVLLLASIPAFLFTFHVANTAKCPHCTSPMSLGWKIAKADGIFRCPKCHAQWRTPEPKGYEG